MKNLFLPWIFKCCKEEIFQKILMIRHPSFLMKRQLGQLGWKQPVGAWLQYPGNSQRFQVIGVAKDFNTLSLHNPIRPFALFYKTSQTYDLGSSMMMVKVKSGNIGSSLDKT